MPAPGASRGAAATDAAAAHDRGDVALETQLRAAETRFRSFFESAPIGKAIVAPDGRFLEVNPALCELVGYPKAELLGMTFQDLTHPDDVADDVEAARQMIAGETRSCHVEKRYLHARGHVVWVLVSVAVVRAADAAPSYFVSQIQDISERKASEEVVRQAELRYRTLVEQLPLAVYIRPLDMTRPNIYFSPQVDAMLGYPAEAWLSDPGLLDRIVHPDDRERVHAAAVRVRRDGEPFKGEYRYIAADGRVVWVQDETHRALDAHGEPCVQGFLLDISERKHAEEERNRLRDELHHAQRLEAIGRLAGGVAHDFNNLLTAIRGYCELLLAQLEPGTSQHHDAEQIHRAAEQASTLPMKLLAFSRKQVLEPRLVDLDTLVSNTADLLRRLLGEAIELRIVPAQVEAFAHVDPGRVEQALVELALNARDAMPSGGTLTISTVRTETTDEAAAEHGVDTGPAVVISVVDTGLGMDADTRARAFEPFFTTKPQGEGSGLGLASVYGTVSQSGGFITVESEPGRGSTFRAHFPAVEAAPRGRELLEAQPAEPAAPLVLLAEDEDLVRELARSVLELAGFDVRAAMDGADALAVLQNLERPVDVLVTDIVMPIVDGIELAVWVERSQPGTPVVFISGYTDDSAAFEAGELGESRLLRKPFSTRAFVQAVRDAHALGKLPAIAPPAPERVTKDSPPIDLVDAPTAVAGRDPEIDTGLTHIPAVVATNAGGAPLTPRERQVLGLLSKGQKNDQVAAELGISPATVQSHVYNAMLKLHAHTRTEAVATAIRASLIG